MAERPHTVPSPLGEAHDISERGFSFESVAPMSVGDLIVLGLRNEDYFLVEATVRNVRQEGDHYVIGAAGAYPGRGFERKYDATNPNQPTVTETFCSVNPSDGTFTPTTDGREAS